MLKNVYEGLNARPKVYLSNKYFCKMYPPCVSSKLCEFIVSKDTVLRWASEGDICLMEVSGVEVPLSSSAVDLFPVQMSCEIHSPCFHSPLLFRLIYFTMENPLPERADNQNIGAIAVPSQGTM